MNNAVVKICRFKGNEDKDYVTGECYLLEIIEAETINPNGVWRRIMVNHTGKTTKIYKTFNKFLGEWDIIG